MQKNEKQYLELKEEDFKNIRLARYQHNYYEVGTEDAPKSKEEYEIQFNKGYSEARKEAKHKRLVSDILIIGELNMALHEKQISLWGIDAYEDGRNLYHFLYSKKSFLLNGIYNNSLDMECLIENINDFFFPEVTNVEGIIDNINKDDSVKDKGRMIDIYKAGRDRRVQMDKNRGKEGFKKLIESDLVEIYKNLQRLLAEFNAER